MAAILLTLWPVKECVLPHAFRLQARDQNGLAHSHSFRELSSIARCIAFTRTLIGALFFVRALGPVLRGHRSVLWYVPKT